MPIYINSASGPVQLKVLIKDISETGISIITKEDLDLKRTFRIKIKDDHFLINTSARIIRKEFITNLDSFLYGCKFIEKNNTLGKYIAKKQAEELRRRSEFFSNPN